MNLSVFKPCSQNERSNKNFYFHASLWYVKSFYIKTVQEILRRVRVNKKKTPSHLIFVLNVNC